MYNLVQVISAFKTWSTIDLGVHLRWMNVMHNESDERQEKKAKKNEHTVLSHILDAAHCLVSESKHLNLGYQPTVFFASDNRSRIVNLEHALTGKARLVTADIRHFLNHYGNNSDSQNAASERQEKQTFESDEDDENHHHRLSLALDYLFAIENATYHNRDELDWGSEPRFMALVDFFLLAQSRAAIISGTLIWTHIHHVQGASCVDQ